MQKQNLKYIVRFNTQHHKSWQFRFREHGANGKRHHSSFSDMKHGGKTKSLKAAITYRNKFLKETRNYNLLSKRKNPKRYKHSLNNSGVLGVLFVTQHRESNTYTSWRAYGHSNNLGWHCSFSCKKYGDIVAFRKACERRYSKHGVLSVFCKISELPASPGVPYKKIKQ